MLTPERLLRLMIEVIFILLGILVIWLGLARTMVGALGKLDAGDFAGASGRADAGDIARGFSVGGTVACGRGRRAGRSGSYRINSYYAAALRSKVPRRRTLLGSWLSICFRYNSRHRQLVLKFGIQLRRSSTIIEKIKEKVRVQGIQSICHAGQR